MICFPSNQIGNSILGKFFSTCVSSVTSFPFLSFTFGPESSFLFSFPISLPVFVIDLYFLTSDFSMLSRRFNHSETGCSCITPMQRIGQSCAVSGTLFFSSPCLFNPPICQRFSVIFSCYFCLSFSGFLSISAKKHKNSSHKHFSNS